MILVAPASRPPPVMGVAGQGPDVILLRPFRIRQFAEAVRPAVAPTTGAPPSSAG